MSSSQCSFCCSGVRGRAAVPKVPLLIQTHAEQHFDQHLGKSKHKEFGQVCAPLSCEDWLFLLKNMYSFALFIHTHTDVHRSLNDSFCLLTMQNYPLTSPQLLRAERCSSSPCSLIQMKFTHKPHLQMSRLTQKPVSSGVKWKIEWTAVTQQGVWTDKRTAQQHVYSQDRPFLNPLHPIFLPDQPWFLLFLSCGSSHKHPITDTVQFHSFLITHWKKSCTVHKPLWDSQYSHFLFLSSYKDLLKDHFYDEVCGVFSDPSIR